MRTEAEISNKITEYYDFVKNGDCPNSHSEGFYDSIKSSSNLEYVDKNRTCKDADYSEGVDDGQNWLKGKLNSHIFQ